MSSIPRSCFECRRRKIRCDRDCPCSYCIKTGITCTYPDVEKSVRRHRARSHITSHPSAETAGLLERIAFLEQRVQQLDGRLAEVEFEGWFQGSTGCLPTPESPQDQLLLSSTPELRAIPRTLELSSASVSFLPDVNSLHGVWETYLTDIDPLLKLVDHQAIEDTLLAFPHVSPEAKSLLTGIHFATRTCKERVSVSEYGVLADAVESSFQAANLLNQPRLQTLQALTIYLTCGRVNMDQDYLCAKLALLVQLAKKLRLDRDPAELGYMPDECEHRRRLWWHIVSLDVRTAEASSAKPLIKQRETTTKLPSRTKPGTAQRSNSTNRGQPDQRRHTTCFAVTAIEMADLAKKFVFPDCSSISSDATARSPTTTATDKTSLILASDRSHQDLLNKHQSACLGSCASDSPICRLTSEWCKIYRARQYLLILHKDGVFLKKVATCTELGPAQAEQVLAVCIDILDRIHVLRSDPDYSRWAWLWQNCVEWDAAAIALSTIAGERCTKDSARRAWKAIGRFFEVWQVQPEFGDPKTRRRWEELKAFCEWVRAFS